jgi:hypothetical protein
MPSEAVLGLSPLPRPATASRRFGLPNAAHSHHDQSSLPVAEFFNGNSSREIASANRSPQPWCADGENRLEGLSVMISGRRTFSQALIDEGL